MSEPDPISAAPRPGSPSSKPTILLVDDEQDLLDLLTFNLEREDYRILRAADGNAGLESAIENVPDLIVLDLMLPGMHGFQVLEHLKNQSITRLIPVIVLTAKGEVVDRIAGLKLGADDYLAKPFSPRELVLRIKGILRRAKPPSRDVQVKVGPLFLDKSNFRCLLDGKALELTKTELKLLSVLVDEHGTPVTRTELLRDVWGFTDTVHTRTLDTHIKRLRGKLGFHGNCLQTIRNVGYCLDLNCRMCEQRSMS